MADIDATESETESEEDGLQVTEVVESLACTVDLSGSTATQDQEATSSVHVPSLLSQLRAPRRSDLTCPRKIQQNATKRTQKSKPSCSTDPASISPAERVREFPNEALTVSAGKLFCSVCREEVSLKGVSSNLTSNQLSTNVDRQLLQGNKLEKRTLWKR